MDCCMFYLFITKYGYLPGFKSYDEDTYIKYFFLNLLMFVLVDLIIPFLERSI